MTLIPMISSMFGASKTAHAPVGGDLLMRGSYNPGGGHRPAAALVAFGLPAALVVAVALSPMIIKDVPAIKDPSWTQITIDKPIDPPPPKERRDDKQTPETHLTTVPTTVPQVTDGPTTTPSPPGPIDFDPGPMTKGPIVDPVPPYVPPTPVAKLELAKMDPRFAGQFQPDYPAREQRMGVEGSCLVRVLVGTDGRVKAVELIRSDTPAFFEATKRRALDKWRFKPATRGGVAEESWVEKSVRFEIREG